MKSTSQYVELAYLQLHPLLRKRYYEDSKYRGLVESMKANGYLAEFPLAVVMNGTMFDIIDGYHRFLAAYEAGNIAEIPVVDVSARYESSDDIFLDITNLSFWANYDRMAPTIVCLAERIDELMNHYRVKHLGESDRQNYIRIKTDVRYSLSYTEKVHKLAFFDDSVKQMLRVRELSRNIAINNLAPMLGRQYKGVDGSVWVTRLAKRIQKERMGFGAAISMINRVKNGEPMDPPSKKVNYSGCSPAELEKCLYVEACRKGGFKVG